MWNERTGEREEDREGNPIPRPSFSLVQCEYDRKLCPKGHYTEQKSLSERNLLAYQHYLRCAATFRFPEDAIVEENAAMFKRVHDMADRVQQHAVMMSKGPF